MENINIGLYGILGIYNYGCEAIVRGTVDVVRTIYCNSKITYFSHNYNYDAKMLEDLDISVKPVHLKHTIHRRAVNKVLGMIHLEKRVALIDYRKIFDDIDEIWSIGGDIYTISRNLREKEKYPYYNHLIDICNREYNFGKRIVLYGASVGPFGNYDSAVKYYTCNLKKYKLIIAREESTLRYLDSLGLKNVVFSPDPAFRVKNDEMCGQGSKIGFNFSPLSIRETLGIDSSQQIIELYADVVAEVYRRYEREILFIPHVCSNDKNDDDARFLKEVYDTLEDTVKVHVSILDSLVGFFAAKKAIRECRFIVAARMHCAISSFVEGVPCILISYSQKSKGMSEYVYGNYDWVVDMSDMKNSLLKRIKDMNDQAEEIRKYLFNRNREIEEDYICSVSRIKDLLSTD